MKIEEFRGKLKLAARTKTKATISATSRHDDVFSYGLHIDYSAAINERHSKDARTFIVIACFCRAVLDVGMPTRPICFPSLGVLPALEGFPGRHKPRTLQHITGNRRFCRVVVITVPAFSAVVGGPAEAHFVEEVASGAAGAGGRVPLTDACLGSHAASHRDYITQWKEKVMQSLCLETARCTVCCNK